MKLADIQQQLKAPKNHRNTFGNYNYRNCEDILEAVKPLLGDSVLTLSDEIVQLGDRYYVKATATFQEPSVPETSQGALGKVTILGGGVSVTAYARESLDKKGMDSAQITGAASSYARKYALNGLFLIDDTKDADSEAPEAPQSQYKPATAKKPVLAGKDPKVELAAQKERVLFLLKELGFKPKAAKPTRKEIEDAVFEHTGAMLTETNLDGIAEMLSGKMETLDANQN